jgi:hypothetical protein
MVIEPKLSGFIDIFLIYKVMKKEGVHEGCIEQIQLCSSPLWRTQKTLSLLWYLLKFPVHGKNLSLTHKNLM